MAAITSNGTGGGHGSDVISECAATFSSGDAPGRVQCKVAVRNAM